MSDIEKRQVTGSACINGIDYDFDAVVFRRVHRDQVGGVHYSKWQYGKLGSLNADPPADDEQRAQLIDFIVSQANSPGDDLSHHPSGF